MRYIMAMDTKAFSALAEPSRLRIVELLRDHPSSVNDIAVQLHMRQPQVSKHLHTLYEAGIVTVHPAAQQRIYTLQPGPFNNLQVWLQSFETSLQQRLDKLDAYLNNNERN